MFSQDNFSNKFVFCYKQLQFLREIERAAKREAEQAAATSDTSAVLEPFEDCDVDDGESDWCDASNAASPASLDQIEGSGAISKGTQAKPAVVSRKSQATLGECLKCVNKKAKIRALQKQNVRLRSQREKWKEAARGVPVSVSIYLVQLNIPTEIN